MSVSGPQPDPKGGAPPDAFLGASEDAFDADVIGVDVIGFSRFTQSLVDRKGAGAAEEVRDVLDLGFRAVADRLKSEGFRAVDSLGDGIILARPRGTGDLGALVRSAEQAFAGALGILRVRAAHAAGRLSLCRIGGLQQRWDSVATGPAIEALHAAMRQKRELEPVRDTAAAVDTAPLKQALSRTPREDAAIPEMRRLAVAFVAIKPPATVLRAPLATLQDVARLGQSLAEACGGRLEKVSHDDKGFLFDFVFARARDVGLTMLDSAIDFLLDLQPLLATRGLASHFGLAEGLVYRGTLSLGDRAIPIVHGPAVNLGAKLAASGEAELALDWSVAQQLVGRFQNFAAGIERTLPGGMRYVGFSLADVTPRASVKPKTTAFVGRDAERGKLLQAAARLEQGSGGVIALSGAGGIGKTKLLTNFRAALPAALHAVFLHADPRRASEHMSLWRDLTKPLAISIAGSASERPQALSAILTAAGIPDDLQAVVNDVFPGSGLERSPRLEALEGMARRELLQRAVVAIGAAAARKAPILIVLDDAHWFDDASWSALNALLPGAQNILVVISHRSGQSANLDRLCETGLGGRGETIKLEPLPRDDIKSVVRAAAPLLAQDDATFDRVVDHAGGNPFHAEQIAHLLNERVAQSVAVLARELAEGPKAIERVLDERLEGLSLAETQIVRTLSIFDRPMAIDALSNLGEDASLLPHLAAHAFIELDGASATMKSRMLIDAVVRHIPPREARTLHGRAARFTRRLHGSDADIAGHWLKAGNGRRAAICFGRAGDDVLYAGAPDLAVRFFDAALSALPASDAQKNTPRVAGWYAGRAVAHWAKGEMHDARADAVAALSLIDDRIGGPNSLPRWIRRSLARTRRTVLAPTPLGKWLVPRDVRAPLVMVSAIRAEMAFFLAKTRDMISATASMTAFASEPRLRARASTRAYLFVGAFTALLGQKGAAHAAWNKARAAGEAANDPIASSHGYLGEALWHTSHGRWREAHELLERAAALYVDVADPAYNKFVETMFALESYFRGDWTASAERFAALHALGVKQGNRSTEAWGLYGQAEALIIARRWNEAETLLNAAEPIVAAMPDLQSQIICKGLRVQIEYAQGRHQRALDAARACLSAAQRLAANNFGSLEGFAAPAEIFLRLALDTRAPEFVRASAHANVKAAVKSLHRFARLHPIAMPRLNLCRALAARLDQHDEMAIRHLRDGLVQARAMDMQFECAKLESELELARG